MASADGKRTILLAGRLNGPKGEVALQVIENIFIPLAGKGLRFVIAGGPVSERHRELGRLYPALEFPGFTDNIQALYRAADIVVGAGRVAFEAMAAGRPVLAIGHHAYCGPALKKNEHRILETNAGDFAREKNHDFAALKSDLEKLLTDGQLLRRVAAEGRSIVETDFKISVVTKQVEDIYRNAMLAANRERFDEVRIAFAENRKHKGENAVLPSQFDSVRLPENPVLFCRLNDQIMPSVPHVRFFSKEELNDAGKTQPLAEIGLCVDKISELEGEAHKLRKRLKQIAPNQSQFPVLVREYSTQLIENAEAGFDLYIFRPNAGSVGYTLGLRRFRV